MRTIKFRAWDTENKKFIWTGFENFVTESHEDKPQEIRKGNFILNADYSGMDNRVIFQQFTGLHDKNGKEIYEGDICKTHDWIKQPNGLQILSDKYKIYKNVVISYNEKPPFVGYVIHDWYEVIGNIYENPELVNN